MAYEDRGGSTGIGFGLGLLTGAAIGIGLGLLFAPKEGAAMRRDLAKRARDLQAEANVQFERASGVVDDLAARGKDVAERARTAVSTGLREVRKHTANVADTVSNGADL
jgi:gas vesicle protein